jgi:hypothetical protein
MSLGRAVNGRITRPLRALRALLATERGWLGVYLLVVAIATGVCIARECNNFLIFRAAYGHLLAGHDLYAAYPAEHADLFKYSPTFALLFAPFAWLPFAWALLAWNLVNALGLYHAIRLAVPAPARLEAIQLVGIGLITTVDGTQSNGVIAALIVLAFVALERNRLVHAALAIVAGVLIKIFPLAAAAFVLPRRDRWRFALLATIVGVVMIALPLIVTPPATLVAQYRSWFHLGAIDALDRGASVMRMLHIAVGYQGPNWPIQLVGSGLLVLPVALRPDRWRDPDFRRGFLASLLVFAVIFNHKAEQPSFVIALVGMAIWHATSPRSPVRNVVTGSTFIATVPILMTVIAPGLIADSVDAPLLVASACCTVAWFTMQGELLDLFPERVAGEETDFATMSDEPAV